MNIIEKAVILGSIVGITGYGTYHLLYSRRTYESKISKTLLKEETFVKTRDQLLETGKVRLLYSSMSYLYLYKTLKDSPESLYLLSDLLAFSRPKFLGMMMSEKDFKDKYSTFINSKEFQQDMKKVDFFIATKKDKEIETFKSKTRSKQIST
jgi:hypothetical protein